MATITIDDMFANAMRELDRARDALSEAAGWLRSDWHGRDSLTDREVVAREAMWKAIQTGKTRIDAAKGIYDRSVTR